MCAREASSNFVLEVVLHFSHVPVKNWTCGCGSRLLRGTSVGCITFRMSSYNWYTRLLQFRHRGHNRVLFAALLPSLRQTGCVKKNSKTVGREVFAEFWPPLYATPCSCRKHFRWTAVLQRQRGFYTVSTYQEAGQILNQLDFVRLLQPAAGAISVLVTVRTGSGWSKVCN